MRPFEPGELGGDAVCEADLRTLACGGVVTAGGVAPGHASVSPVETVS